VKIAFVCKKFIEFGGMESYIVTLAERLLDRGYELHIFCNEWTKEWEDKYKNRVKIHKVPVIRFFKSLRLASFAFLTYFALKKEDFDIIQGFGKTFKQDILRTGGGCHKEFLKHYFQAYRNPFLKFLIKSSLSNLIALFIEKRQFQKDNYKKIIAVSKRCKEEIKRNYGVPDEDIDVIYNGVDLKRFNPANKERYRKEIREKYNILDNEIVLLYIGSGFRRKGVEYLLKAISNLRSDTKLRLLIVGRDENMQYYKKLVGKIKIEGKITFTGEQPKVERFYAAADIFILLSVYEPFSNACLEAMASGLPIIITRINGVSEIIENGKEGYIIENAEDIKQIKDAIIALFNKDKRIKMGYLAKELVSQFTIEKNTQEVIETYNKVFKIC
jgi:UDP-glucose:(heptosyl)LPS alpha-1,3-glucosyltransferase